MLAVNQERNAGGERTLYRSKHRDKRLTTVSGVVDDHCLQVLKNQCRCELEVSCEERAVATGCGWATDRDRVTVLLDNDVTVLERLDGQLEALGVSPRHTNSIECSA